MRLVAATRILDEDDIVEAFVRHNAAEIDHFLFLDDGSQDRTIEILSSLRAEGFSISLFRHASVSFAEVAANTWLYQQADRTLAPDWVCFLDCDEFISTDDLRISVAMHEACSLHERLGRLPPGVQALRLRLVNYVASNEDDAQELLISRRLRWRHKIPHEVHKIFLRGGLSGRDVVVGGGNHSADIDGVLAHCEDETYRLLAHFPRRSAWHEMAKSFNGWLKALAAGEREMTQNRSLHYQPVFERLRDDPASLMFNESYVQLPVQPGIHVFCPMYYRGAALRYTCWQDPRLRAVQIVARGCQRLAERHGRLLDAVPAAFEQVVAWDAAIEQVI